METQPATALDKLLLENIESSLSDFIRYRSSAEKSLQASAMNQIAKTKEQSATEFVKQIVDSIVFGPAQEVFSGSDIIQAIDSHKANAFVGAFAALAGRIIDDATRHASEETAYTYRDFRDIFVLTTLFSALSGNAKIKPSLLSAFFPGDAIHVVESAEFHDALLGFFYGVASDEDSGVVTLPLMFHHYFSEAKNSENMKWTRPPHIDQIFNY